MNKAFGDKLSLNSWAKERLPEYLWLRLILSEYEREEGLKKCMDILYGISKLKLSLDLFSPRISDILSLNSDEQRSIYKIIKSYVNAEVLSPMTVILRGEQYEHFNQFFYCSNHTLEFKVKKMKETLRLFSYHQDNTTTDLRYLALFLAVLKGKMVFQNDLVGLEAIKNYAYTNHEDEHMRMYRPFIRATEGIGIDNDNREYIEYFWREFGTITGCEPMYIKYEETNKDLTVFIKDIRKLLEYFIAYYKIETLESDKFSVIFGTTMYILKISEEVNGNNLYDSILGRQAYRTILESYIMMKYLCINEVSNINIFRDYKLYGIGKYKHVLLKARESSEIDDKTSQINKVVLSALVNETLFEEYLDIDVRYFDSQNIKKKFDVVGELQLYETFYEYNNNYVHGFWGAVRESSMLPCDNPLHSYHCVLDIENNQKLTSVKNDLEDLLKKHLNLISTHYEFPKWFKDTWEEDIQYGL